MAIYCRLRRLDLILQIDYEEFVHAMVLYCMYTRDEILHCECLPSRSRQFPS